MKRQTVSALTVLAGILTALWVIDPVFTTQVVMPLAVTYLRLLSGRLQVNGRYAGGGYPPLVLAPEGLIMSEPRVILELTRAHPGTEAGVLTNVANQLGDQGHRIDVLGMPNQASGLAPRFPQFKFHSIDALLPDQGAIGWILAEMTNDPTSTFVLFSFHPKVFGLAKELNSDRLRCERMARFTSNVRLSADVWPNELMSLDQAVKVLVSALGQSPTGSMDKTYIRQALVLQDSRFAKRSSPAAATPGLISILVQEAEDRGLVTATGTDPQVEVTLTASGRETLSGSLQIGVASATAALPTIDVSPKPPVNPHPAASAKPAVPATASKPTKQPSRSTMMIEALRESNLGYQKVRDALHNEIETLAYAQPSITLAELLDEAHSRTEQALDPADHPWVKGFAWGGLRASVTQVLLQRPVVLGQDGKLIRPDWEGLTEVVTGLTDTWREDLLGEEVLAIARKMKLAPAVDARNLAGALFLNREPASLTRISKVVAHLLNTQRLEMDESAALQVPWTKTMQPTKLEIVSVTVGNEEAADLEEQA